LPLLDFLAVRALLGDGTRADREPSARFLWSVIERTGATRFFERVYLTNLSWFGFAREGRNLNLDALPEPVRAALREEFAHEMALARPRALVPLGRLVERGLAGLRARGRLEAPLGPALPHPRHCAFPSRRAEALRRYGEVLAPYLNP
jgi:hypothetical protein